MPIELDEPIGLWSAQLGDGERRSSANMRSGLGSVHESRPLSLLRATTRVQELHLWRVRPTGEHGSEAEFAVLDRFLPGIIALLVGTNALAAPPDAVAPHPSVEIAPIEIVAAPAPVLESSPVVIDAAEQREIAGMATAEPISPIRDPVMRRRGLALAISSVVGAPLIGAGGIYILGEQFDCAFGAALGGVSRKCPHGPLGPTLIGVGAATSITLLAVGLTLVRKSKTPKQGLAVPTPIVSRHGGGVAWAIRF